MLTTQLLGTDIRTGSLGSCEPMDFQNLAEESLKLEIKFDSCEVVNPWIEIPNVLT